MALYHSTFRWLASLACTTLAVGLPYNLHPPSQLQYAVSYLPITASRHTYEKLPIAGRIPSSYINLNAGYRHSNAHILRY